MVYIYHNKRIPKLEGTYENPQYFSGPKSDATVVITDDKRIADAYKGGGIEFRSLSGGNALDELKKTAEKLGVKFPQNIKFDTLKAKVEKARK